jgi:hypothetical protein
VVSEFVVHCFDVSSCASIFRCHIATVRTLMVFDLVTDCLNFFKTIPPLYLWGKFSFCGDREGMIQILRVFVCFDCMILLSLPERTTWIASFRSSPVDCSGSAVILHVGGSSCCLVAAMSCVMRIFEEG